MIRGEEMKRDTMFCMRITSEQKDLLYKAARASNMSLSEYARNLLNLQQPFPKFTVMVAVEEEE